MYISLLGEDFLLTLITCFSVQNFINNRWFPLNLYNYFQDGGYLSCSVFEFKFFVIEPSLAKTILEIWDRAQLEAARRPKSDFSYVLGGCKMCKNLRGQHPKGRNIVSRKKSSWVGKHARLYFFVCGPKFTKFLTSNVGGVVVDHLLFRFSFCWVISELFALKVDICQKSRRILDDFCPPKFCRGTPCKISVHLITPA